MFVTDADYKHTLTIVRSLGKKGIMVDVGTSYQGPSLSSFSKYCYRSYVYPNPKEDLNGFTKFFYKKIRAYDAVIPVGYVSSFFLSMKKSSINNKKIPLADFSSFKIAANKKDSVLLAKEIDVPVPKTFFPNNFSELMDLDIRNYPVVVKGIYEGGFVRYAYNKQDLREKFEEIYMLQRVPPLIQEFINGQGYGFFALFNHGKLRAVFMHRRIRERNIIGGPSTCAESVFIPKLMDYGLKILNALKWHGVAMVEFRRDLSDGEFKFIEINPKFWGSLDLATASGVDFPYLLYRMVVDGDVKPIFNYRTGLRFMWPIPDDLLRTLKKPADIKHFLTDFFNPYVKKNICIDDSKPTLFIIWSGLPFILSKVSRICFS